jgi:M6 family metalloprotease-like protein
MALIILLTISTTLNIPVTHAAQTVRLTGTLHIVTGDPAIASQPAQELITVIDSSGNETRIVANRVAVEQFNSKLVEIVGTTTTTGSANGIVPAVRLGSIRVSEMNRTQSNLPLAVTGSQPWVNIMCRFSDSPDVTPKPVSYFVGLLSNTYPGLDYYWRELSYNLVNIAGSRTASQWYNLPQPRSYYIVNNTADLGKLANDCTAVADAEINYPTYVGINMMFNQNLDCCAWGGGRSLNRDGQNKSYRITWMPPWGYRDQSVLAHEMGHGFGLPHSSGPYGQTYDSDWDVMSWGGRKCQLRDTTYGCVGSGTISYHLDRLGWVATARRFIANRGTRTILTLEKLDLPQSTTNYLMAQIPIPNTNKYYTVETRIKGSFDTAIPISSVIIHQVDPARASRANVVDPDNNNNVNDAGAAFIVGETFNDDANQISVKVTGSGASSFTVVISNGVPAVDTIGVYHNGVFYLRNSNAAGAADVNVVFGAANHLPVAGDWNGDGFDTIGVYDTGNGFFYLRNTNLAGSPDHSVLLGNPGDKPLAGRWDNTMTRDGVGVYRNANGILYLKRDLTSGVSDYFMILGNPGDQGVAGDWDGNGYASTGVYRPSNNQFYLTNTNGAGVVFADFAFAFGDPTATAFAGDWTGSGVSRVGYYKNGTVYLRNALTAGGVDTTFAFGPTGAIPIAGKWLAGSAQPPLPNTVPNILIAGGGGSDPSGSNADTGGAD